MFFPESSRPAVPHWGNYFGAIRQHIALQDNEQAFYFIADLHALTTIHDAKVLQDTPARWPSTYLALGLDPKRATLFRQSDVPEVTELTWLLMTVDADAPSGKVPRLQG